MNGHAAEAPVHSPRSSGAPAEDRDEVGSEWSTVGPSNMTAAGEGPAAAARAGLAAVEAQLQRGMSACKTDFEAGLAATRSQILELQAAARAKASSLQAELDSHKEVLGSLEELQADMQGIETKGCGNWGRVMSDKPVVTQDLLAAVKEEGEQALATAQQEGQQALAAAQQKSEQALATMEQTLRQELAACQEQLAASQEKLRESECRMEALLADTKKAQLEDRKELEAKLQKLEKEAQAKEQENATVWSGGTYSLGWVIKDYSAKTGSIFSPVHEVDGDKWQLKLFPQGYITEKDHIAVFLAPAADIGGQEKRVQYEFVLINQLDPAKSFSAGLHTDDFKGRDKDSGWGYGNFFSIAELKKAGAGWVVDDQLKIKVNLKRLT